MPEARNRAPNSHFPNRLSRGGPPPTRGAPEKPDGARSNRADGGASAAVWRQADNASTPTGPEKDDCFRRRDEVRSYRCLMRPETQNLVPGYFHN